MLRRKLVVLVLLCAGILAIAAVTAQADTTTYVVTSTADIPDANCDAGSSTCTLRSALLNAALNPGTTDITLPAGTFDLSSSYAELYLDGSENATVNITGAGAGQTIIQGNGSTRVLEVGDGATLTITGVTLTGGDTVGDAYSTDCSGANEAEGNEAAVPGGAINDEGTLTLNSDAVTDSISAGNGGGIEDTSSTPLTITGSTFSGDVSCQAADGDNPPGFGNGGAIAVDATGSGAGDLDVQGSTITGNFAPGDASGPVGNGGGIAEDTGATVTVTDSTVSGNAAADDGGGISGDGGLVSDVAGSVALVGDTLTGNTAEGGYADGDGDGGGAVSMEGDELSVDNSTITDNNATQGGGGGIQLTLPDFEPTPDPGADISFATITDNSAPNGGGANLDINGGLTPEIARPSASSGSRAQNSHPRDISPSSANVGFTIDDSIVTDANASGVNCGTDDSAPDDFTSDGYNLFDDNTCPMIASDQQLTAGTKVVNALANNGGSTQTEALFAGSPAVDAANSAVCAAETSSIDQRGVTRPQGSACDIGAFELEQPPDLTLTATPNPATITVGAPSVVTDTITNVGKSPATGVTFTDPSSGPYTINGATPKQGNCSNTATTVTCSLGSLARGASTTVAITLTGTAAGTVTLDSAVTETQTDPTPANNLATATVQVVAPAPPPTTTTTTTTTPTPTTTTSTTPTPTPTADVGVTKTASATHVLSGRTVTYTVKVTNHGPGSATGVQLTDAIPSGEVLLSRSITGATCTGTTTLKCTLGTLADGASKTVTYAVHAFHPGTLSNTAKVTSTSVDPNLANNHASATIEVTEPVIACAGVDTFRDSYNPSGYVNMIMVYLDGKLVSAKNVHNARTVALAPPKNKLTYTWKVVFLETNQARDTQTRAYRACRAGVTHTAHTLPVPPPFQSIRPGASGWFR